MTENFKPGVQENSMDEQIKIAEAEAKEHVMNNITEALPGRKCVDGRYLPGTGQLARAGGDMGYVEVLLALNSQKGLNLTPEQCFDYVYTYVTRDGGLFYMHTDTHADPDEAEHDQNRPIIGCGACEKPTHPEFAGLYGLDPQQVTTVINYARERQAMDDQEKNQVKIVRLEGGHAEKGTLVVTGEAKEKTGEFEEPEDTTDEVKYTVNASDKDGRSQYFIYDKQRDQIFIRNFVTWLRDNEEDGKEKLDVTEEEFMDIADKQTDATLHILAKGKPVLHVVVDTTGKASDPKFLKFVA